MGDQMKKSCLLKREAGNRTIDCFFAKKPKNIVCIEEEVSPGPSAAANPQNEFPPEQKTEVRGHTQVTVSTNSSTSIFSSDIGQYVGETNLDDQTKAALLQNPWLPPADYVFPYCIVNKKGKPMKKYAQRSHLDKFHWFVLSHKDQGLYCKYCVLFGKNSQKNTHPLGRLVKKPLKAFDDLLGVTVSLSRYLQSPAVDLKKATGYIQDTLSVLEDKRLNAKTIFHQLYSEITEVASELDCAIKMPRTVSRQTQRANVPADSTEDYFRRVTYVPLLDSVIADLKDRLSADIMKLFNLNVLLPRTSCSEDDDVQVLREVASAHSGLLEVPVSSVVTEYQLWVAKWKRLSQSVPKQDVPTCLMKIIDECDNDLYPAINCLLRILATLPVSVATGERSFSTLRRVKSWLRASMGEERLVGLALLNIHRDIDVDVDAVITRFSKGSKTRLEFIL